VKRRNRGLRGQALVESALVLPILVAVVLGAADLSRAFITDIRGTAAARAGLRTGISSASADVGDSVRSEVSPLVPDTNAVWGAEGPTGARSCAIGSASCGDLQGCPTAAFAPGQTACFAVGTCALNAAQQCAGATSWNTRPGGWNHAISPAGAPTTGLRVRVVFIFTPATPFIGAFVKTTGGRFYLTSTVTGLPLY
jgi:hypothetical protein